MKKNLFIALAIGGLMVTSCSEDVYVEPDHESFSKDFTEIFGPVSADENWNAFETKSVSVTGNGNDVKVYAQQGSTWACVGNYTAVSGSKNITFEALKTADAFIVKSGSKAQYVTDGASVNFAGSRAINSNVANVFSKIDYKEFSYAEVMQFATLVPEEQNNQNVEGLTKNFSAKQKKGTKVRVYPVYWNAGYTHTFGVYTKDANGKAVKTPIFTDKKGDNMCQYWSEGVVTEQVTSWWGGTSTNTLVKKGWNNFRSGDNDQYLCWNPEAADKGYITKIQSQGVELLFSEDVVFGFYIEANGKTFYSEASLNDDKTSKASFFRASTQGTTYDANGTPDFMSGRTFLGFDDVYDKADNDLNDLVVVFDPEPEIMNEESSYSAIMACEDLGETADYDFNDIVFEVSYKRLNGETTEINVTPLAAGGTLSADLYFGEYRIGEIHQLLGGSAGSFINTEKWNGAGKTINIPKEYINKGFTITETSPDVHGGFYVKVAGKDQTIALPTHGGQAPMMMCLPATWKWPTEKTRINIAYPHFGEHGGNFMNQDWYKKENTVSEKVIAR